MHASKYISSGKIWNHAHLIKHLNENVVHAAKTWPAIMGLTQCSASMSHWSLHQSQWNLSYRTVPRVDNLHREAKLAGTGSYESTKRNYRYCLYTSAMTNWLYSYYNSETARSHFVLSSEVHAVIDRWLATKCMYLWWMLSSHVVS